ncbi:MAG: hypothetical protein IT307_16955 [Chloroflexi bacterium]|nr:hypothetical protein [Chloroflexota bacterium]
MKNRSSEKINREIVAYEAMHPRLAEERLGEWVAIHQGALVDHDRELSALYKRIRARYGRTSVLLRQVSSQPQEELRVGTPSTGRRTDPLDTRPS